MRIFRNKFIEQIISILVLTTAGLFIISASGNGPISANQEITESSRAPYKLSFITGTQTIEAGGVSGIITVKVRDEYGNSAKVSGDKVVNLTSSSVKGRFDTSPTGHLDGTITSITIRCGTNSTGFYYMNTVAGPCIITASSDGLVGADQEITVSFAAPNKLSFITGLQTIEAGEVSGMLIVKVHDAYDNPAIVPADTVVDLSSSSPTGIFDVSADGPFNGTITSVIILSGTGSASFYYKDTTAGMPAITASIAGLGDATQTETVRNVASAGNGGGVEPVPLTTAPGPLPAPAPQTEPAAVPVPAPAQIPETVIIPEPAPAIIPAQTRVSAIAGNALPIIGGLCGGLIILGIIIIYIRTLRRRNASL